jgi:hypothetical protein
MKNILLFACIVSVITFSSCSKTEIPTPANPSRNAAVSTQTVILQPPVARRVYAGLYVNDFDQILGNQVAEDTLLAWSKRQGFNVLSLYKIRDILLNSQQNALAAFCTKARSATYGIDISFVAASASTANSESGYYQSRSVVSERQSYMLTEYEFWNSGNSFATFSTIMSAFTNARNLSTTPKINRQAYVSQYKDAANLSTHDTVIARQILDQMEYIVQVNYTNNAYNWSGTLENRLQSVATAAFNKGITARVIILFNCNYNSTDPNIYSYFSTTGSNQPFVNAFNTIKSAFNANTTITNKNRVSLVGYQIYRYTEARQARP